MPRGWFRLGMSKRNLCRLTFSQTRWLDGRALIKLQREQEINFARPLSLAVVVVAGLKSNAAWRR